MRQALSLLHVASIASKFVLSEEYERSGVSVEPIADGNINHSFLVQPAAVQTNNCEASVKRYILQQINTSVFPDVSALMHNIFVVTTFLQRKQFPTLQLVPLETATGVGQRCLAGPSIRDNPCKCCDSYCFRDQSNNLCWRMYEFIPNISYTRQSLSLQDIAIAAAMFMKFQLSLVDFPMENLHEIIPNFHNTIYRLNSFDFAVVADPCDRIKKFNLVADIDFVNQRRALANGIQSLQTDSNVPLRIVHNDTKLSNILFIVDPQSSSRSACVIDLDTVMPGLSLYDVADMVRTVASTCSEDEPDLSKVAIDTEKFAAIVKGFSQASVDGKRLLVPAEVSRIPIACQVVTS